MYMLLVKQFIRSKAVVLSFILIVVMGIISILIGRQFLSRQENTIRQVTTHQREHIERNVAAHDEMGLLLYYLRFSLISKPDKLAALSIGQRDVNPGIQSVTIRTLEGQKYDTDLNNPSNLQSGNLDLGFIILYLFPLLIIAFTFNLLSEEKEAGTWRLIAVQARSAKVYLLQKVSVRAVALYSWLVILLLIAILVLSLPVNEALWAFIVASILYLAFWFAFCFWIITFRRSSSFNVLTLLSAWVVFTILLPASVNNVVADLYPVPESLATMVKQRDGYHEKWDIDKASTMKKFYAHYPQYESYGIPKQTFSWLWYYAMQQMGDDESLQHSQAMHEKILQRERMSRSIAMAMPAMHTQLLFNDVAGTSLTDYIQLLDSTRVFHERMRLHFYPKIFDNAAVKDENWKSFIPEYISDRKDMNWSAMLLPLIVAVVLLSILSVANMRQIKSV
jgi:ABC-2 type transport system permease protein